MKCINNKIIKWVVFFFAVLPVQDVLSRQPSEAITEYELDTYRKDLYRGSLFADELCVTAENIGNPSDFRRYNVTWSRSFRSK